jgi:uncharacterized protein (DUF1697 family)
VTVQVAFLGGINVGGHRVTMDRLRAEFESLGLDDVRTFIASGNVIFSTATTAAALEPRIEGHLREQLGYDVPTFVRSASAVGRAAGREPFGTPAEHDSQYVVFLRRKPTAAERKATEALSNEQDRFAVHGTELHWLVHGKLLDSNVKPAVMARALGQPSTTRNVTSLRKLAATL